MIHDIALLSHFFLVLNSKCADSTHELFFYHGKHYQINMALSGIQMLLNYEVVPPSDVKNILRVLAIQASAPRIEFQLKILQVPHFTSFYSREKQCTCQKCIYQTCNILPLKFSSTLNVDSTAYGEFSIIYG